MTQCEMIVQYMKDFKYITPAEAVSELGCYRLAARIADLKDRGYDIGSYSESRINRYGKKVTFSKYFLRTE